MGTLYFNGKFYSLTSEHSRFDALFSEDGTIVELGSKEDLQAKYHDRVTEYFDYKGKTIIPGLVDSHAHMLGYGFQQLRLDLSQVKSREGVFSKLEEKAQTLQSGDWLIAEGWNENEWEVATVIHRRELDERFPDRPVMLTRICRHAMIVNSKALELAGLTNESPDPSGGVIGRDEDGLNGLLLEEAQDIIHAVRPRYTNDTMKRALTAAYEQMVTMGLTGVHTEDLAYYNSPASVIDTYREVIEGDTRKFRVHHLVHHDAVDEWLELKRGTKLANEYQTFGSMKIFADGSLGGHSAWLSVPYVGEESNVGVPIHQDDELEALIVKARNLSMTIAVHVIGDQALDQTIRILKKHPPNYSEKDRLIHLQIVRADLMEELKAMPVVLDLQPQFTVSDFPWVRTIVDEALLEHAYAWKTLLANKIACAGGSDAPIEVPDPRIGIHAAVTRRARGESSARFKPGQCLSIYESFRLYTSGSASAIGKEEQFGQLAPGYASDFTVFHEDPFQFTEDQYDELLDLKIAYTIVNDKVVFAKEV
ncbi:amidohydrolase [Geomicrobium sediminis]|uniref:Amidohydrolase YtcJ n=1 Tax=Geomicrobium sediminis TaxID=1347788 RepID=A0ABS2P9U1_9BACL|nr:amidohydrolase [Geomicrobium sediminis]MBM7631840.1 putative amidohydrolase YtcJ [Geomicrobium sediminis]